MSLEKFLKDCKRTGYTPVSYRCDTVTPEGKRFRGREYVNPKYAYLLKGRNTAVKDHESNTRHDESEEGKTGYLDIKESIMALKGENVVVHSKDGYHYGRLIDFDGKRFVFGKYYFDKDMMDSFSYNKKAFFRKDSIVPAKGLISIMKMPLSVN